MRTLIRGTLLLLLVAAIGCAQYSQNLKATKSIGAVKRTTNREDVKNCRRLGYVDSNDANRGCGLTAQPTTDECLRYQVLMAGGDTLLANGSVGEAYQCSAAVPTASEPSATPTPSATPAPRAVPPPSPTPAATPAATPPKASPPAVSGGVRFVQGLEAVKGCVYVASIDLKAECPAEGTGAPISCISERAARAGGNTVLVQDDRALIFSCKPNSQ